MNLLVLKSVIVDDIALEATKVYEIRSRRNLSVELFSRLRIMSFITSKEYKQA